MTSKYGLSTSKMAGRIYNRKDNASYRLSMIKDILDMYMDEIYKAMLNGERVQLRKIGTIIPEIKTHVGNYTMPTCNNHDGDNPPPHTRMKITRNDTIRKDMNNQLMQNIQNGILGLKELPLKDQQIGILKKSGYIQDDADISG